MGVPLGLALIIRHALRRERALGAEAPIADPGAWIAVALIAGVIAVNLLTEDSVLWAYPVALGWLGLAPCTAIPRCPRPASRSPSSRRRCSPLDPAHAGLWTQLALALLLLAAGLASRARERA